MDIIRQVPATGLIGTLITTFILGFTTFLLLLWYSYSKQNYWKKRGVPYAKPFPFLGSVLENMKKPHQDLEVERYKKYGRIYGHFEFNQPLLSVGDLELTRNILVKDFQSFSGRRVFNIGDEIMDNMLFSAVGEDWKRLRTIISPTFSTGKIKRMIGIFKECAKALVENFKAAAEKGEPIELKRFYGAFTMDVIASSAFSTKINSHNDPNNEFVANAREFLTTGLTWKFLLLGLFPGIMKFFRIKVFSGRLADFFINSTKLIIEERKKTGQRRNDFLQLLMDTAKELSNEDKLDLKEAEYDITENYGRDENDVVFKHVVSKKSLSQNELISQCILFFLVGYDTTASTLTCASYLLATNPDAQEKLIQEIDDVLRENNGELTYEAIQGMKYLDNVISETLRMFPPATRLERKADEDYKLGDTGIIIPKGMIVTIPTYALHRDADYFPDPEKFNPGRFSPEEREKRNPYSYAPFGVGPRNCIAMRFALMETKVCLASILRNLRLKTCPETKIPIEFNNTPGQLQPKEVLLQVEVRTDTVKAL